MLEENKRTVLRQIEALHRGDLDTAADLTHPNFFDHEAASSRASGPEGLRKSFRRLRDAFAGLRLEPLDVIAETDRVVVRARCSGRHVGEFAGVQPTGREFSVEHVHIWRLAGGKIIEHWASRDDYGLLRQLAVLPEPEAAQTEPRRAVPLGGSRDRAPDVRRAPRVVDAPERDGARVRDASSAIVAADPSLFDNDRKESRCSQ